MDDLDEEKIRKLEYRYVESTYNSIAKKFSDTRYKKWPQVENFMRDLDKGSLVLDVGCGNGKYLDSQNTINIGCDISSNLLSICRTRNFQVVQCDMMKLPFRESSYDCVICIAALHHIVTSNRRLSCLRRMTDMLRDGGKLFVQVWSFEQNPGADNKYLKSKARPTDDQSVRVCDSIELSVHKNRTQFKSQEMLVPFETESGEKELRYYHLFRDKELDGLITEIDGLELLSSCNDNGNWCATAVRRTR